MRTVSWMPARLSSSARTERWLIEVTTAVFEEAGRLEPADLRLLDAIHVAAALDLGDGLEGLVTYDDRLARAAQANAITAITPK